MKNFYLLLVLAFASFLIGAVAYFLMDNTTTYELTVVVYDKYPTNDTYKVSTDKGVFNISNGVLPPRWSKHKIYNSLQEGSSYVFTVTSSENLLTQRELIGIK